MHCGLFLALSRLGMMWRERSWSKALALCCSCGNGRPMFQNPFWMPWSSVWSLCCISSVNHAKLMLGAGCDRRAEVWEVCHCIIALKPEHNLPKEARISYRVTPFCISSYMTNALHVGFCKPPMKSKARVSVSLGLKMRVAENVLSTRRAQYWIRLSACHHSQWPEENWPALECSSYSK